MKLTELDLKTNGQMYFCKQINGKFKVINGDLVDIKTLLSAGTLYSVKNLLEMEFEEYKNMPKSPYERVDSHERYWYVSRAGKAFETAEAGTPIDDELFNASNYYNNENYAEYRALKEDLERRMDKFAWEHNQEMIDWNDGQPRYYVYYNHSDEKLEIDYVFSVQRHNIHFTSRKIAEKALEEFKEDLMKVYTWKFDF